MRWDFPTPTIAATAPVAATLPAARKGFWPYATVTSENIRPDNSAVGAGGVTVGGTANQTFRSFTLRHVGSGGVGIGEESAGFVFATHNLRHTAEGGAVCRGDAVFVNETLSGRGVVVAKLPLVSASLVVEELDVVHVRGLLPSLEAILEGGISQLDAKLPTLSCALLGFVGVRGEINSPLPLLYAEIKARNTYVAKVAAKLHNIEHTLSTVAGGVGRVAGDLTQIQVKVNAHAGGFAKIQAGLTLIHADLRAGSGGRAHIAAKLTTVGAEMTVTVEEILAAVISTNTRTGAVSTYENFPYNSFCYIGGKYFGGSATGLTEVAVGDSDVGDEPILAGLGTGNMKLSHQEQKRISGAVMALHTEEDLQLTVTTDEGAKYPAVTATMNAMDFRGFRQRRIVVPRGIRGATWKFEINNVTGGAFDFGHIGIDVAASARRI